MNIEIWMEGYAATGEYGTAMKIWDGEAESFDDAVQQYINSKPKKEVDNYGPHRYTRNNFVSDEAYQNRRAEWNIWGCALFNNEQDARKSFG